MKCRMGAALVATCCFLVAAAAAADFTDLARRIPENNNAIGMVDMSALLASPLAKQGNWASKNELIGIPIGVGQAMIAGQFNPSSGEHNWRFKVAKLARPITMNMVAQKVGGQVGVVGNHPAVFTKDNMAVVELAAGVLGMHSASNRQELTRWVRFADENTGVVLNPFLRDFIKADSAAQIRFALDTGDLLDPEGVKNSLMKLPSFGNNEAKAKEVARKLSTMKGISLSIRVTDTIRGTIKVDFDGDVSSLQPMAQSLFKEILMDMGLYRTDLDDFKAEIRGNTAYFEGTLEESGLRQIMTMLTSDQQSMHTLQPTPPEQQMDSPAATSKRYFNGVTNLIADLRTEMRQLRSSKEFAYWYEHTARKIDQLPSVGVDPEMLDYGGTTADKLRAMGANVRGTQIDVEKMMSYKRSTSTVSYSGGVGTAWGYGFGYSTGGTYFNNNYADVAQQQSETIAQGAQTRVKIWEQIDGATGAIRRAMSQKFGVEF